MNNRGRPRKYLTIEEFHTWKENEFAHVSRKVAYILGLLKGGAFVIVPLLLTILTILILVLLK